MTRTATLLARLGQAEVLLADGASGTALQGRGLEMGKAPESWVFEQEERVRALHREYVQAGSEIVLSCSFGGTCFRLKGDGLDDRVVEVNRRAAEIAREAAGEHIFVAGDMGPTGQLLAPLGAVSFEEMVDAYAEQVQGLAEGGVDLLIIETMSDLGEARAAIEGARRVADLPIFCTFSFDSHGRTMMGVSPAQVASELGPRVEGIGANCGRDPDEVAHIIRAMRSTAPAAILWAKPNAGLPHVAGDDVDQVVYDAKPEYMAQVALQLRDSGAQVIGGCCGTTSAHIQAMGRALKEEPR